MKEEINYGSFKWSPTEDIGIILSDETAENRSQEALGRMIIQIRSVVSEYGFDLSNWGNSKGVHQFLTNVFEGKN